MKCPLCEEEFGYLRLHDLEKFKSHTEFHCPKCKSRLDNTPVLKISRRVNFYIYGGLLVLILLLAFEYLFAPIENMITWSAITLIGGCLLRVYIESGKYDSAYYQVASAKRDA